LNKHTNNSTYLVENNKFINEYFYLLSVAITTGFLSNSRAFDRSRGGKSFSKLRVDFELPPNNLESKPRF
jgi:hypothetical protein